ncbi:hypothetical protein CDO73_01330 [Saccharibacillus sp. O23]|uniref:helix-turn-helix transcriptional regulator n=1 Tax=Saccharibacillus sp. O23 TaxID=2009338 RepID=UPI000B4E20ED|nr:helix-turn-helix domain-containing protein [Saccharibacillus sp. O23]OWR33175.1 hypothetical protein CDO73_01330 [Saccharibacillus sp. O23]
MRKNSRPPGGESDHTPAYREDAAPELSSWRREHTVIPDLTFPLNVFHIRDTDPDMLCIPPHWHEHLEWIVVLRGRFSMQIGTGFRELGEGGCAFVNTAELHSAFPLENGSELYALVFGEALLRNHALDHTETRYVRPLLEGRLGLASFYEAREAGEIRKRLLEIVAEYRGGEAGFELLVKSGLLGVLGLACRQSGTPNEDAAKNGRRAQSAVYPLLLHLSEHFRQPIGIAEAAAICCVTPTYFCHVFKRTTGKTLSAYINTLRVHEAEGLLRGGGRSVQEIARLVGYEDAGYFARVFKKLKGTSPSRYAESSFDPLQVNQRAAAAEQEMTFFE